MKKIFTICLILLCTKVFAYSPKYSWLGSSDTFALDPVKDGILIGTGVLLNGTEIVCCNILELNKAEFTPIPDKNEINAFDRFFMNPYSKPLDLSADVLAGLAFASPLLFLGTNLQESPTLITMYIETLLLAKGTTDSLKSFVQRTRPCMYYNDYPQEFVEDNDWYKSWPSGHTTYTFATAAFLTYTFSKLNPDSKLKYAVIGGSYAIALTTGILRVASGNHFATDVLSGAAIGTAWGFFVPWIHTIQSPNNPLTITPAGFDLSFKL